jgi:hypothetical protein
MAYVGCVGKAHTPHIYHTLLWANMFFNTLGMARNDLNVSMEAG